MDTRYLEQLLMIEKSRSMRGAAEQLYLSQATLSHNLKKLEAELECELFDRSHNQLKLNAYGKIMVEHSRKVIDELALAKREIAEEKMLQAQRLQIGVYSYAFQSFVVPSLSNCIQGNTIACMIRDSVSLETGLMDGLFDVIFTDREFVSEGVVSRRLFQEQIMVSFPYSSAYAAKQNLFLSDLKNLDIMLVNNASGYTQWFLDVLERAGAAVPSEAFIPFKEYLYIKDGSEQCHMLSSFIMRFLPMAARRVVIPLHDASAFRDICMVYKKQDEARLSELIACIEENQDRLFAGSAFLPFFLFPDHSGRLVLEKDSDKVQR